MNIYRIFILFYRSENPQKLINTIRRFKNLNIFLLSPDQPLKASFFFMSSPVSVFPMTENIPGTGPDTGKPRAIVVSD